MKTLWIVIGVAVLGAIVWVIVSSGGNATNTNQVSTTNTNTTTNSSLNAVSQNVNSNANAVNSAQVNANTAVPTAKAVSVTASGFSPKSVQVSVGQSVTWTNNDSRSHSVAPNDHPTHVKYAGIWDDTGAGSISAGQTYVQQFNTAGTYQYHDHLNPSMTGTVVVE